MKSDEDKLSVCKHCGRPIRQLLGNLWLHDDGTKWGDAMACYYVEDVRNEWADPVDKGVAVVLNERAL